jgi:hypothetical protein
MKCRHDVSQDCPACMQAEIDLLRLERDAAEDVARTAKALAASALEPFADVYSGGEGFEGYHDGEQAYLTCGRVKHYGLTLGCFKRAAIAYMSLSSGLRQSE